MNEKGARIFLEGIAKYQDVQLQELLRETRATALLEAADALDNLWDQRKVRMAECRDWADGVAESESLLRELAAKEMP